MADTTEDPMTSLRCLVVDDHPFQRKVVRTMLLRLGINPAFRTSAKDHPDFPASNGRLHGEAVSPAPCQPYLVANNTL
jgi:CheY-like chemotaxis protein